MPGTKHSSVTSSLIGLSASKTPSLQYNKNLNHRASDSRTALEFLKLLNEKQKKEELKDLESTLNKVEENGSIRLPYSRPRQSMSRNSALKI